MALYVHLVKMTPAGAGKVRDIASVYDYSEELRRVVAPMSLQRWR